MPGAVELALDRCVVGIAGRLSHTPIDAPDAVVLSDRDCDERTARRLERFIAVEDGSFVWTRSGENSYFLGRIAGPWFYDAGAQGLEHARPCRWIPIPEHLVPPATLQTFARGGRNFQQTHDAGVGAQSSALWTTSA